MNSFVDMMQEEDAYTLNGALTHSTTNDYNVDLFFLAGACRKESQQNIENVILKSYQQDRLKTLKIIFWAGDIRQGAGERRFFKIALNWLNKNHPEDLIKNLTSVPFFSRWDVLFEIALQNDIVLDYIVNTLKDENNPSRGLLCKWLPRKVYATDKYKLSGGNITKKKRLLHGGIAKKIQSALHLTEKQYRKLLVEGTKVVEQQMCANQWEEIEYSKVPSVAMNKYTKAWYRHDLERFKNYIKQVMEGKAKINASAIFPHDILRNVINNVIKSYNVINLTESQIAQWNSLPNYLPDVDNFILPVCDVSASMQGLPIAISVSLGLYISERNKGPFKDAFLTFSTAPELHVLKGDLSERLNQLANHKDWEMDTDLQAVFEVILKKAKDCNLDPSLMPKKILIISDMEFNACVQFDDAYCTEQTNFEGIKAKYLNSGYELPQIIFWNVNGRQGNCAVKYDERGTALVSGASPSIIKSVFRDDITPQVVMNETIEKERYNGII